MEAAKIINNRTLGIVHHLLAARCTVNNTIVVVRQGALKNHSSIGFEGKGSTRIEVLFDSVVKGKTGKSIRLQGLAEDCEGELIPIAFYCETRFARNVESTIFNDTPTQTLNSFVIDPVEKLSSFCNTEFSVIFENSYDGSFLGTGKGYLRFGKD